VIKTKDLRPCDSCGGPLSFIFYTLKVEFRQMMINRTAVNEVVGTAQIFGGNLDLGTIMSPDRDAANNAGYHIKKDLILCQSCVMENRVTISPIDLMIEHEEKDGE